jgi:hypothetical protein
LITITPTTSRLLKIKEKKMYHKSLGSADQSSKVGAYAPHRAKLIQQMMMESPWIQQQALSKPQIVQSKRQGDQKITKLPLAVCAPEGFSKPRPPHLHTLIKIT